jgi:adenosylcobinamide kinase/adenosylcobinamide-phosphate guanylyltransferase
VISRRKRSHLVFVLGGASSGKSEVALSLGSRGVAKTAARAFVATGEGRDEEMAMKIARHRQSRSPLWMTAEVPLELAAWFNEQGRHYRVILVDCLTMWLSNHWERGSKVQDIIEDASNVLKAIRGSGARVVVVSNELGMGLVPVDPLSRSFRELAGEVNRLVAQEADEAYFVVSGLFLPLKRGAP